jgi:hypothetical protein
MLPNGVFDIPGSSDAAPLRIGAGDAGGCMDREVALFVLNAANAASRQLADLAPLLQEHCDEETARKFRHAIGQVLATITFEVQNPVFALQPELREEIDARVERYGRAF